MENLIYLIPAAGLLALLFTYIKSQWVSKQDVGTEKMASIAKYISDGAMAFLRAEYKILAIFVVIVCYPARCTGLHDRRQFIPSCPVIYCGGRFVQALQDSSE